MAKAKVRKCLICEVRPSSNGQGYCKQCLSQIEAEKRRKMKPRPFRYLTYRGVTFEFRGENGSFKPHIIAHNPETLPQKLLINLDKYCPGFSREQVKKLKRLCAQWLN